MSAANINRTVISGNLTQDPELRHTGSGTPVCRLRVAVNSRRKVEGQWVDKPNYFNVIVWGKHGETCNQYLAKGRRVSVEGRLDWREYQAKDNGGKREAIEIIADTVEFGPKPQQSGDTPPSSEKTAENTGQQEAAAGAEAPAEPEASTEEQQEEDIPF